MARKERGLTIILSKQTPTFNVAKKKIGYTKSALKKGIFFLIPKLKLNSDLLKPVDK